MNNDLNNQNKFEGNNAFTMKPNNAVEGNVSQNIPNNTSGIMNQTFPNNNVNEVVNQMGMANNTVQTPEPIYANNVEQPMNQTFPNNNVNEAVNQMGMANNIVQTPESSYANSVEQPMKQTFTNNNVIEPMSQPTNQTMFNNVFNGEKTENNINNVPKSNDAKKIVIFSVIAIIAIAVIILIVNSGKNKSNNNFGSTSNNSSNSENNNSANDTDRLEDDSKETVKFNTFGDIGEDVKMKVTGTQLGDDKYDYIVKVTFRNDSNKDVVLNGYGWDNSSHAHYQVYFVPKTVDLNNISEDEIIAKSCILRKIVRETGEEITFSSGDTSNTMLNVGETVDGIIKCSITNVDGYASGVDALFVETTHYVDKISIVTLFNAK